jgi:hypothetical protein
MRCDTRLFTGEIEIPLEITGIPAIPFFGYGYYNI